jgi:hypothetical protein
LNSRRRGARRCVVSESTLRRAYAARYVTPLREGGSLPAIVETDAGELFVAKWRGAGQGAAALVAEVIAGQLGRALGLRIPELVILDLDDGLARTERDQEIGDLLRKSAGTNLGMGYLSGAIGFDPAAAGELDGELAARIVAFDAFVTNVDRTARNPNMLWWQRELWLIDHGASLYWHHGWDGALDRPDRSFPLVRDHVLLRWASDLADLSARLVASISDEMLHDAAAAVPDEWLEDAAPDERRAAYVRFLRARRDGAASFIEEAVRARAGV